MTIAITRNLPKRFDGFISSCMHEVAHGVYAVPKMNISVGDRLWRVMLDWVELIPQDVGVVILWRSPEALSGLGLRVLGWPKKELIEYEGIWLTFRRLTQSHDPADLVQLSAYKEPPFDDRDKLIEDF